MSITSILRDLPNNVCLVRIISTDTLSDITNPGYIAGQAENIKVLNNGEWEWFMSDMLMISASDGIGLFQFTDDTFSTVIIYGAPSSGTITPGTANDIAFYPLNGTTIAGLPTLPNAVLGTNNLGVPAMTHALPPQVQVSVGSLDSGTNASNATFWRGDGQWASPSTSNASSIYGVFVAPDGSDTLGNGSIVDPFQTIAHAISTITTASSSSPFNIILIGGQYNEAVQIKIKPFVNIVGMSQNTIISNSSPIILDPIWNSTNDGLCHIENLTITGNVTLDFATVAGANNSSIQIDGCYLFSTLTMNGNLTPCFFFIYSSYISDVVLNNAYLQSFNNFYFSSFTGGNNPFTSQAFLFSTSDYYNGTVTLNGAASGIIEQQYTIRSSVTELPISLNGAKATLFIDVSTYVDPVVTGGAVVSLTSIADGAKGNYAPVNYTVPNGVNSTIKQNLAGIDAALGGFFSVNNNIVWVSPFGSNTTGNGSYNNPYLTIGHALTTITTASFSNPFTIFVTAGLITETSTALLKPYVNICSTSEGTQVAGTFTLHSSWGSTASGTMYIQNINFTGSISLNFDSFSNTTTHTITIANSRIANLSVNNNANTTVNSFFYSCNINFGNFSNSNNYIFACQFISIPNFNGAASQQASNTYIQSCVFSASVIFNSTAGAQNHNYYVYGSNIVGSISVSNNRAFLNIDVSSYKTPTVSGGATVNLVSIANGLLANYTPTNYTPTDPSVKGHLEGINNALSAGNQDMETTYTNGSNATIIVQAGRPLQTVNNNESFATSLQKDSFKLYGLGQAVNAFDTPPGGTFFVAADRMEGYTFTPTVNLFATKFQYYGISITSKTVGLWEFGNTTPLATATLTFFDLRNEVNQVFTEQIIDPPILLNAGTKYVLAGVVSAGTNIFFGAPTGVNANITLNSGADGPNTSTLTYPSSFPGAPGNVNGNYSLALTPTTPVVVVDSNYQGFTTINSFKSDVYPFPILTTGWSSMVLRQGLFQRIGNVVDVSCLFTCNPNSLVQQMSLIVPYMTTNFPDTDFAAGVGNLETVPFDNSKIGTVYSISSDSSSSAIIVNSYVPAGGIATQYLMYLDFKYYIF